VNAPDIHQQLFGIFQIKDGIDSKDWGDSKGSLSLNLMPRQKK